MVHFLLQKSTPANEKPLQLNQIQQEPPAPHSPAVPFKDLLAESQSLELDGRSGDAIQLLRAWLSRHPSDEASFAVWYEYGRLLQLSNDFKRSEHSFRACLELKPFFFEGRLALGKALESQGRLTEALKIWEESIAPKHLQIDLLNNIARLQEDRHDPVGIEPTLIRSLELNPNQDAVLTTLLQVRQKLCRWPVISPELPIPIEIQEAGIGPLMSLALFDDPLKNLGASQKFVESKSLLTKICPAFIPHTSSERQKISVGFLSADFRLHATSIFFSPLIEQYDRNKFSVHLLDLTTAEDAFPEHRDKLLHAATAHHQLQKLSDKEAVDYCRRLELDILVDLGGLTAGARPRIIAERVAPVQVGYIGFLASTAIPDLDYIITTRDLFPPDGRGFTEAPLYLDGPYLTMDEKPVSTNSLNRTALNIPPESFLFGALLNTYKINADVLKAWVAILKGVPSGLLWLIEDNTTAKENLITHFRTLGGNVSQLRFTSRVHPAMYRNQLALCDLFLDAFPYGSGATARDVIHANLPMLTRPGKTMMSRLSSHMMANVGVTELAMTTADEYVRKAIELGNNKGLVENLKLRMTEKKASSKLFARDDFVNDFYNALQTSLSMNTSTCN